MKNLFAFFLFLVSFAGLSAMDIDTSNLRLVGAGVDDLIVTMEKPLSSSLKLRIQDQAGVILHQESFLAGDKLAKKYDLADLPVGQYELILADALVEDRFELDRTSFGIRVNQNAGERKHMPYLQTKHGITNLTYLNKDHKKVSVSLLDERNETIYTEQLAADNIVSRRYNFRSLPEGNYRLVVVAGRNRVTHELAL